MTYQVAAAYIQPTRHQVVVAVSENQEAILS